MKYDLALTATGAPAVVMGSDRYPLVMTIAGMKEWAEYQDLTFEEAIKEGWNAADLSEADLRVLLKIALVGGERRRALFAADERREITDDLVSAVLEMAHPAELVTVLIKVWNEPPAREPDPQKTAGSSPPGE